MSFFHANGAGEGNRTLIASLEGWSFAIKLHPLILKHTNYLILHQTYH